MSSIKEQTLTSSKWNFIERISVLAIQFLLGVIMARLLLPSDFGTIGLIAIFFEISQVFVDSGFSSALIRTQNPKEEDFCTVFYFNLGVSVFAYVLLFFSAPWIASFFNISILRDIVRIQSVTLVINAIMAVQVSMLNMKLNFKALAKRNIIATSASGLLGICLAYFGYGIWALVWQQITAALLNLVIIIFLCKWYPKKGFNTSSFKKLGAFGSKLFFAGLLQTFYINMTTIAIGRFYSTKELGVYSRGEQFATLPGGTINGVLQTVTYPILARIQDNDNQLISVYRRYIRMSSLCIFIVSGILCVLAKPIILLLLTEKWIDAVIYLHIFAFTCMFDHLSTINLNLLKVKGRSDLFLKLEVIKKTISITILLIAIPHGVLAICISKFIYGQIATYINTYYTGKLFNLGYLQQVKDFLPYFIYTILACLPIYSITLLNLPNIVTIALGSTISLFLYWFMLRNNPDMQEMVKLIKNKMRSH